MTTYLHSQNDNLLEVADRNAKSYQKAEPFPNIHFIEFFNPKFMDLVLSEFPDLSQKKGVTHNNQKEIKLAGKGELFFGNKTTHLMHFLNSEPFLQFLQILTGIDEPLIPDPYFSGGGQHEIKKGGLLKIHADFNKHPKLLLDRRINVLIYLNKDWKEEYGGNIEFWDKDMKHCTKRILPKFNTMAVFSTSDFSYHGHPDPLNCPDNMSRKSLALYYYSNGRPTNEIHSGLEKHSTLFQERKGNVIDRQAFNNNVKEEHSPLSQGIKGKMTDRQSITNHFNIKNVIMDLVPPIILRGTKRLLETTANSKLTRNGKN